MSDRGASSRRAAIAARESSLLAVVAIALMIAACGAVAAIKAVNKPLWFDELFTLVLARLRSPTELVDVLRESLDAMPPLYYLVCRAGTLLVPAEQVGVRLPSLAGFLGTMLGVYCFLSPRTDRVSALAGAAFVAGTVVADYAYEARPYALLTGAVCGAACAWQRSDRSWAWAVALACLLGLAVSSHYFAVFVWPAFVLAETLVIVCERRLRMRVWLALAAGFIPFVMCWPLLAEVRVTFSQNPWIPATRLSLAFFAFQVLFKWSGGMWAMVTAAVLAAVCVVWIVRSLPVRILPASMRFPPCPLTTPECGLALGLLAVPLVAVVVARIANAGMTERYMMPAVIGAALTIGALASVSPPLFRAIALSAMLVDHGLTARPAFIAWSQGDLLNTRTALQRSYEAMISDYADDELPVVFANGLDYIQMVYYCPPENRARAWAIAEPTMAVEFSPWKSAVIDSSLLGIRPLFPMQLAGYDDFIATHDSFILCANDDQTEWLTAKLLQDGHALTLLAKRSITRIYTVSITRR